MIFTFLHSPHICMCLTLLALTCVASSASTTTSAIPEDELSTLSSNSNATDTTTLSFDSLKKWTVVKPNGTTLTSEAISTSGEFTVTFVPFSTFTKVRVLGVKEQQAGQPSQPSTVATKPSTTSEDENIGSKTDVSSTSSHSTSNPTLTSITNESNVDVTITKTITATSSGPQAVVWPWHSSLTGSPFNGPTTLTITMEPYSTYNTYQIVPWSVVMPQTTTSASPQDSSSLASATVSNNTTTSTSLNPSKAITAVDTRLTSISGETGYSTILETKSCEITSTGFFTRNYTLEEPGTQWMKAINGTTYNVVTIIGPTTQFVTATEIFAPCVNARTPIVPYLNTNDPGCNVTGLGINYSAMNNDVATLRSLLTTLAAGESLITSVPYTFNYSNIFTESTFIGPTTAFVTAYEALVFPDPTHQGLQEGLRCGGHCGICNIMFKDVNIFYWPVDNPNTACLNTNDTTQLNKREFKEGGLMNPVLLEPRDGQSTLVVDGYTFTSPSVYVAFPTISAVDACGTLGSVHTSVTMAYPSGQLSTIMFQVTESASVGQLGLAGVKVVTQPFDFANAVCPPASLSTLNIWSVVGDDESYRPLIAPVPRLTGIDPAWAQICQPAAFQGRDPPRPLTPYSNLEPNPTPRPVSHPPSQTAQKQPNTVNQLSSATTIVPRPGATQSVDPPRTSQIVTKSRPPPADPTHKAGAVDDGNGSVDPHGQNNDNSDSQPNNHALPENDPSNSSNEEDSTPSSNNGGSSQHDANASDPADDPSNPDSNTSSSSDNESQDPPNDPFSITISSKPYTADSSGNIIIQDQTLTPGSHTTIDGQAINIPPIPTTNPDQAAPPLLTVAGQTFTADSNNAFIIDHKTFHPGDIATISGTPITIPQPTPSDAADPSFDPAASLTAAITIDATASTLTLGGSTYTKEANGAWVFGGETLTAGGVATVSGVVVSAEAGSGVGVETDGVGIGSLILKPFGDGEGVEDQTEGATGSGNRQETGTVEQTADGSAGQGTVSGGLSGASSTSVATGGASGSLLRELRVGWIHMLCSLVLGATISI